MNKHVLRRVTFGVFIAVCTLQAQDSPKPTCKGCSASYIANDELEAYFKRVDKTAVVTDQQVRVADIGKSNVAIGVVYRPQYEQYGNYVPTNLPQRYDAFLFIDQTEAVRPLFPPMAEEFEEEAPETYPSGV